MTILESHSPLVRTTAQKKEQYVQGLFLDGDQIKTIISKEPLGQGKAKKVFRVEAGQKRDPKRLLPTLLPLIGLPRKSQQNLERTISCD